MENSRLKARILMEMKKLIAHSHAKQKMTKRFQAFHEAIIKKHYNASDVCIDYHRHRVKMNIIMDDTAYDPKTVNLNLGILPTNLFFNNLKDFLKSCLDKDSRSIAFYARLVKDFSKQESIQMAV